MKECKKFIDNLPFHYQGGGLIRVEEIGIEKGWRAALEWAKKERDKYIDYNCNLWNKIDKESEG